MEASLTGDRIPSAGQIFNLILSFLSSPSSSLTSKDRGTHKCATLGEAFLEGQGVQGQCQS